MRMSKFMRISADADPDAELRYTSNGNPKIGFFFSKKFEIRILTFDEELKSP